MRLVLVLGAGGSEASGRAPREASWTGGLGPGPEGGEEEHLGGRASRGVGPRCSCRAWGEVETPGKWLPPGGGRGGLGKWLLWVGLGGVKMPREGRPGFSFKGVRACVLGRGTGEGLGQVTVWGGGKGLQRKRAVSLLGFCRGRLVELISQKARSGRTGCHVTGTFSIFVGALRSPLGLIPDERLRCGRGGGGGKQCTKEVGIWSKEAVYGPVVRAQR